MKDIYQISRISILLSAFFSFMLSIYLWFFVDRMQGLFVGIWVPSILSFGNFVLTTRKTNV